MGKLAAQKRRRHQAILKRDAEIDEYYVAASLHRFVDDGRIVVYRVAHLVGRSCFDETLKSTAHGGTIVNNKESRPLRAGHGGENLLQRAAENNSTGIRIFLHYEWPRASQLV